MTYFYHIHYGVMVGTAAFHENKQGSNPCVGEEPDCFFILNLEVSDPSKLFRPRPKKFDYFFLSAFHYIIHSVVHPPEF